MKVNSTRFGNIEVEEKDILTFPEGLVGFSSNKRFFIYNKEENLPFFWLQSVDDPGLAFVICDPLLFFPDYKISVRKEEISVLNVEDEGKLITCVIVSVNRDPFKMTANLQGPLIINTSSHKGKQLVLLDGNYTTRHKVLVRKESLAAPSQPFFFPMNQPVDSAACSSLVLT